MGAPPDEHLPEVVPEEAPQALDSQEAFYHQDQFNDKAAKYLAIYDDAPKYMAPEYMAPEHAGDENGNYVSPINTMTDPQSILSPTDTIPWDPSSAFDDLNAGERSPIDEKAQERTICGLRRNIFFLLLGLSLLVIGGSVGGGVGGGITAANNRAAAAAAADAQKTQVTPGNGGLLPTQGSANGSPSSPVPSPEPTSLNNQTQVKRTWSFQGWSGLNFTGTKTRVYWGDDEAKFRDMPFLILSYVWLRASTGCCVTFCGNLTSEIGWRYEDWKREEASEPFDRIYVGCLEGMHGQMSCSREGIAVPKSTSKVPD